MAMIVSAAVLRILNVRERSAQRLPGVSAAAAVVLRVNVMLPGGSATAAVVLRVNVMQQPSQVQPSLRTPPALTAATVLFPAYFLFRLL
jgi:hypothetical protein